MTKKEVLTGSCVNLVSESPIAASLDVPVSISLSDSSAAQTSDSALAEIRTSLNLLTRECSALSEESRNSFAYTSSAVSLIEKRTSARTIVLNLMLFLVGIIGSAIVSFFLANNFDTTFIQQKLNFAPILNGSTDGSITLTTPTRIAESLIESANLENVGSDIGFYEIPIHKIPELEKPKMDREGLYAIKLAKLEYLRALKSATNSYEDKREIYKGLFAVNYWLGDLDESRKNFEQMKQVPEGASALTDEERLSDFYREAFLWYVHGEYESCNAVLARATKLDIECFGRSGGQFSEPLTALYVRSLVKQGRTNDAAALIKRFEAFRAPYKGRFDFEVVTLKNLLETVSGPHSGSP